jgi:hypothetical protein
MTYLQNCSFGVQQQSFTSINRTSSLPHRNVPSFRHDIAEQFLTWR